MSRLLVAPIVEGHGEEQSIRGLIDRVWRELINGEYTEVLKPIRRPRSKLIRREPDGGVAPNGEEIAKAIEFAWLMLAQRTNFSNRLVLLLLDADEDCPKHLAPAIMGAAPQSPPDVVFACILANVEIETWFIGGASGLKDLLEFEGDPPDQPEQNRLQKGWIARHMKNRKYRSSVDQAKLVHRMDLKRCRATCPSFDKFCRTLEQFR